MVDVANFLFLEIVPIKECFASLILCNCVWTFRSSITDMRRDSAAGKVWWQDHHGLQGRPSAVRQNSTEQGAAKGHEASIFSNFLPVFEFRSPAPFLQVMNVEDETIFLRRMDFFHQYNIEVWLRKEASTSVTDYRLMLSSH